MPNISISALSRSPSFLRFWPNNRFFFFFFFFFFSWCTAAREVSALCFEGRYQRIVPFALLVEVLEVGRVKNICFHVHGNDVGRLSQHDISRSHTFVTLRVNSKPLRNDLGIKRLLSYPKPESMHWDVYGCIFRTDLQGTGLGEGIGKASEQILIL